jgi:hypothetical protein
MPYIALWNDVTGLATKPLRRGRAFSLEVNDSEAVLRRQGAARWVKWLYRQNARYGLSVVAIRETGLLPITLERLGGMMRQRLDANG